ncbi:hypothetical protein J4Q44_G00047490 [Coregonus suidteri]|uniref:Uncharacterized protein n=1 Tax=Coregonus suidteri TaxID=861788 RepID=A0AAN8MER0_9TELE
MSLAEFVREGRLQEASSHVLSRLGQVLHSLSVIALAHGATDNRRYSYRRKSTYWDRRDTESYHQFDMATTGISQQLLG